MALVQALADAKSLPRFNPSQKAPKYSFFSFPDQPDMPHASYNGHTGPKVGRAHFHRVDQIQVMVEGECKIGRHHLSPYSVHFSRAYTPYGPLSPINGGDYSFVVMRAQRDAGPQHLDEHLDQLRSVPDRKPWQISVPVSFPTAEARSAMGDVDLRPVPQIKDDNGLAGFTLILRPNARAAAPDPSCGDGQYLVVVKGSLWHENKEHKALTLVFVTAGEAPYQVQAGAEGLEAIVLNFPVRSRGSVQVEKPATRTGTRRWQCELCAFVYDEAQGLPDEGIAPGTRWEDVPESWTCPDCSVSKGDFRMIELEPA